MSTCNGARKVEYESFDVKGDGGHNRVGFVVLSNVFAIKDTFVLEPNHLTDNSDVAIDNITRTNDMLNNKRQRAD